MWTIILAFFLLFGQLGRIEIISGISLYLHDLIIVGVLLYYLSKLLRQKRGFRDALFIRPLWIFIGAAIVSLCLNSVPFVNAKMAVGTSYLIRYVLYASIYLVVLKEKKPATYWFSWIYILGIAFALLGYIQLFLYPDLRNLSYLGWDPHYKRMFSTLFDPNFLGAVLGISLLFGVYLIEKGKQSVWFVIGFLMLLGAICLTFSRSTVFALFCGVVAYILLRKKWKYIFVLITCMVIVFTLPAIGGVSTNLFRQETARARVDNWREGIGQFFKSPIIGHGFNMTAFLPHTAPTLQNGTTARSTSGYDSSLIFVLVTTGIVGFASFVYLINRMVYLGMHVKLDIGATYLSILIFMLVHSMFVNSLFYPQLLILLWIATAAVEKSRNS